ncbi:cAMP-dependent protein kinase catalytic subunit [Nosema bombycis CQ1]|uniref:cAMP-dependent protein kinase n=1 Tax=Nosema bombycis (strain CQ1 / CVCC 102059) TaxID=578461 RepID=R0M937_NOSB1|nr:cAMP-dependent protein kinase catalytic subunit [Nosema bombycis CQ1]|eukprot:EOB14469.1 cAMP-dependent protein kinase catalytic subunit [Nosema bombycis CQ1]
MLEHDDFKIVRKIGTGAFGKVYLAQLVTNQNIKFAIKILNWRRLLNMRQGDQLENEINVLRILKSSPFVTRLIGVTHKNKSLGIVMEYISGGELFYWLRRSGKFSEYATRFYAAEILAGLSYIHQSGFIYKDLKPENILLTPSGHIKLTDFGFAMLGCEKSYIISGTPEYMSPEKLLNDDDGADSDFWSFGIIIYEMLVGDPPFFDNDTSSIYHKILKSELYFPDYISPQSRDIIRRLLSRDRQERLGYYGIKEIMSHGFFKNINWQDVHSLKLRPPIVPSNFKNVDFNLIEDDDNDSFEDEKDIDRPYDRIKIFQ